MREDQLGLMAATVMALSCTFFLLQAILSTSIPDIQQRLKDDRTAEKQQQLPEYPNSNQLYTCDSMPCSLCCSAQPLGHSPCP